METTTLPHADGSHTAYTYDTARRHIRTVDYDAGGAITCDIHYEYDAGGNVSGWRIYQPAGVLFKRIERHYGAGGDFEDRQYNAAGDLEWRFVERYDPKSGWQQTTYDPLGRRIDWP